VIKKSGNRQLFDRKKILNGLLKACEKRPVSTETLEAVASEVEKELQEEGFEEVPSSYIGEKVMEKLKKIDQVAYVRFASVYREFRDVDQFIEILGSLVKEKEKGV
jgi:transcriptional repressor NrdR